MKANTRARIGAVALITLVVAACGDPDTTDRRGYTKAPLENPQPLIRGEQPGEMARYGQPNRVVAEAIVLPEAEPVPVAGPAAPVATVDLPEGVTQEMVAQGEEIFNRGATCFTCHGAGGIGGPLAPALNEADWIHIDGSFDSIVQIIVAGVPVPQQYPAPMPPLGGSALSDEQVRQIAAYIYAISR
jgi:mono/diheme cytochrome c family protein